MCHRIVNVQLFGQNAPVAAGTDCDEIFIDTRKVQQVLFDTDATLLGIQLGFGFAHAKLHVQIPDPLVQDIAIQRWFDKLVPYRFWVEVSVLPRSQTRHEARLGLLAAACHPACVQSNRLWPLFLI
jgi:hypothetical protein